MVKTPENIQARKKSSFCKVTAFFFSLLLLASAVSADGMMFTKSKDAWYLQPEQSQFATIHYENGMENLLISVNPGSELNGNRAVWIFPVPATPDKVRIDILKGYPQFTGNNLEESYSSAITTSTTVQILYATFPVPVFCGGAALLLSTFILAGSTGNAGNMELASRVYTTGVEVHAHVEKSGFVTEVITATDANALQKYLVSIGMDEKRDERKFLQGYIGNNNSFVVSYISDLKKFKAQSTVKSVYGSSTSSGLENEIGVFARFPVEKIYFPLRPTAVYGSRQVPVLIYVTGFTNPELYDSIRQDSEVTYFIQGDFTSGVDLAPFFNGKTSISWLKFTRIKITTASDNFTEDLWIDPNPPLNIAFKDLYLQAYGIISVVVYVIFSMIASLLAGILAFRKKTIGNQTLLIHGLWNCATFIGLALATRRKFPQHEYGKRGYYILAFYLIFGGLLSLYVVVLNPSMTPMVLVGWIIGLLSPILSLAALFLIPLFLSNSYYVDIGARLVLICFSVIILILAISPIPVLALLKRWLDPEPETEDKI